MLETKQWGNILNAKNKKLFSDIMLDLDDMQRMYRKHAYKYSTGSFQDQFRAFYLRYKSKQYNKKFNTPVTESISDIKEKFKKKG